MHDIEVILSPDGNSCVVLLMVLTHLPENLLADGRSNLETIVGSWRQRLVNLFELAKVENGHPHRFRDTFAIELLLTGVPIERVSVLLGHQSVRIAERHYSAWVRSGREQLEADLVNAWSRDPVVEFETKGTREVHGKRRRAN
jgi:integrase/recombinase XerD